MVFWSVADLLVVPWLDIHASSAVALVEAVVELDSCPPSKNKPIPKAKEKLSKGFDKKLNKNLGPTFSAVECTN